MREKKIEIRGSRSKRRSGPENKKGTTAPGWGRIKQTAQQDGLVQKKKRPRRHGADPKNQKVRSCEQLLAEGVYGSAPKKKGQGNAEVKNAPEAPQALSQPLRGGVIARKSRSKRAILIGPPNWPAPCITFVFAVVHRMKTLLGGSVKKPCALPGASGW